MPEAKQPAEPEGAVEIYEPLEQEPPLPAEPEPATAEEAQLDVRAKGVMPAVWLGLAGVAIALGVALVMFTLSPPHRTPIFQAAAPTAEST